MNKKKKEKRKRKEKKKKRKKKKSYTGKKYTRQSAIFNANKQRESQ